MTAAQDFEYLRGVAQKYGLLYGVHELDAAADNMTADQLDELRAVYAVICTGDNRAKIDKWIGDCYTNRANISKRLYEFALGVGQVFVLFKYIARRGIQPFCDEELEHAPPALKPNWQNLPSELSYLIDLAEAYGHSLSESDMIEFLENAHPNDLDALTRAAERMRLKGDSKRINKWLDEFPLDKYPEAAMVYSLLGVMDLAGLRFE